MMMNWLIWHVYKNQFSTHDGIKKKDEIKIFITHRHFISMKNKNPWGVNILITWMFPFIVSCQRVKTSNINKRIILSSLLHVQIRFVFRLMQLSIIYIAHICVKSFQTRLHFTLNILPCLHRIVNMASLTYYILWL